MFRSYLALVLVIDYKFRQILSSAVSFILLQFFSCHNWIPFRSRSRPNFDGSGSGSGSEQTVSAAPAPAPAPTKMCWFRRLRLRLRLRLRIPAYKSNIKFKKTEKCEDWADFSVELLECPPSLIGGRGAEPACVDCPFGAQRLSRRRATIVAPDNDVTPARPALFRATEQCAPAPMSRAHRRGVTRQTKL